MDKTFLFLMPLIALALIIIPLVITLKRKKAGRSVSIKKSVLINACSFIGCMALMICIMPVFASAEGAEAAAEAADGLANGLKYIGAALSTGMATIGTGIAVGHAAPAAIGATSEDEKNFTKSLIFVALGEGVAIYGLLISILILNG
ncbi:MAG: hypothetical protein HFE79_09685 [Ruminiclostridium sp.]|jgi:V/A-type H+-transporting ATPase subunit K|nr:hypothetical protein [Ruminiclostridium sp.]